MQLVAPQINNYLPLLTIIPLALVNTPSLHLFGFAILLLIRPSSTQSYCNAIISVVLSILLLLDNFHIASSIILEYCGNSLSKMQRDVLLDYKIWVFICQAAFLILWTNHSYKKYKELKAESILL